MSAPFYATRERQAALDVEATSWLSTPFMAHVAAKGVGVDCVQLSLALYQSTGFVGVVSLPGYSVGAARHLRLSMIVEWVEKSGLFEAVDVNGGASLAPGDLLGMRLTGVVHHLGVVSRAGYFVHATPLLGVVEQRTETVKVVHAWRPVR